MLQELEERKIEIKEEIKQLKQCTHSASYYDEIEYLEIELKSIDRELSEYTGLYN